jgi:hypothetical protein
VVQIDPNRTISAGRVDIGAFRTYPAGYSPPHASTSEYQSIPLNKIEDFGVHANQYYSLDVQIFKSSLDTELLGMLWNKYWVNTLSQSPLISVRLFSCVLHLDRGAYIFSTQNRAYAASQLTDLHQKLTKAAGNVPQTKPIVPPLPPGEKGSSSSKVRELYLLDAWVGSDPFRLSQKTETKKDVENQLAKAVKDRFVPSILVRELVDTYRIPVPRLPWKRSMGSSRRSSRTCYSPVGQDRHLHSRLRPPRRQLKWPLVSRVDTVNFPVIVTYMIHQLVFINKC